MVKLASTHQYRLTLVLDTRVALEALLVTAWRKTPASRRPEWLRQLVLQGFRSDCRGLRQALTDVPLHSASPSNVWSVFRTTPTEPTAHPTVTETAGTADLQTTKPLAQLRKLIG
tara:strand:+ start:724 stop:1068 length:345 start_codon:yes stop_codon:yes gene_type:complete